jgi:hypothetical protein
MKKSMEKGSFCWNIFQSADKTIYNQAPAPVPRLAATLAAALCIFYLGLGQSWAGPPFRTDDPEPVDFKHGEFYAATQYEKDKDATSGTCPHFEFNYGVLPDVMLHVITPVAYSRIEGESGHYGYGDTEVGIKYRFYNDEDSRVMAGTFPLVELPSGDSDKGLGSGHTAFFAPLWLQKGWGPWLTYGGGGHWSNPGEGNKDYWLFGWEAQREMSRVVTLGAEVFYNTKTTEEGTSRTGFNAGAIVNFSDDHHLLFSTGRDIHGDNRFSAYLAYQYTFGPPEGKKEKPAGQQPGDLEK